MREIMKTSKDKNIKSIFEILKINAFRMVSIRKKCFTFVIKLLILTVYISTLNCTTEVIKYEKGIKTQDNEPFVQINPNINHYEINAIKVEPFKFLIRLKIY